MSTRFIGRLLFQGRARQVPRLLQSQDKATGRFGTGVWIVTDQNVIFPLAAAWSLQDPANPHYHSQELLDAIMAAGGTITHHHAVGADHRPWMRSEVGDLGVEILRAVKAVLDPAGILAPGNLFDLHPDWKALLLLARLKQRNAESIFGAIADELAKAGTDLLAATTFLDDSIANSGLIAGPKLGKRQRDDLQYGFNIAIYPSAGMSVVCAALESSYGHLKKNGSTEGSPTPAYTMAQLHELTGFPEVWEFEKRFAEV